ncbi:MAG: hypothetical protein IJ697_06635 [Synergistaceae bacterium]|nr:hypothetical protein [Synergistaceae bacterium]
MNQKFNRRFNSRRKSIERWYAIVSKFAEFESIVTFYDGASPDEIRTLRAIHKKLYDCCITAKKFLKEAEDIAGIFR